MCSLVILEHLNILIPKSPYKMENMSSQNAVCNVKIEVWGKKGRTIQQIA